MTDVPTSYDRVAAEYVIRIYDELQRKPFDREMLGRFAARMKPHGLICDLGSTWARSRSFIWKKCGDIPFRWTFTSIGQTRWSRI